MTAKVDLLVPQGEDFRKPVRFEQPAGTLVHFSGFSGFMQVRPSIDSDIVLLECSTEDGGIILADTDPNITFVVSSEKTIDQDFYIARYSLLVTSQESPDYILQGRFVMERQPTRV